MPKDLKISKEQIKTIVELFISWNGETDPIDISNLDSAVDFISECLQNENGVPDN